ncbi:hypothetical protein [Streptomyces sp. NPDC048248]|uniref:hypothetical protein n=1 Tax=Streptomyces sp. NPDC048248 TaxID=3365523 RepID=UPI0037235C72
MTEDQALMVQKFARLRGLDAEAAPLDDPTGEWRLYRDGADVTAQVVAALKEAFARPDPAPVRGFIIPTAASR